MEAKLHPVHQVYDGLFNTASGKLINLLDPQPDTICLYDIAKGLSNICRFGGQINNFHSVAKHTLLVWYLAPKQYKRAALLHDAAEAYLGDIIKPLKVLIMDTYGPFEDQFSKVIFDKYHVDYSHLAKIKTYDMAALGHEHNYHRNGGHQFRKLFSYINELLIEGSPCAQLLDLLEKEFGQYE